MENVILKDKSLEEIAKQQSLNTKRETAFETRLGCIKAGICPSCGTPLILTIITIRIVKIVWISLIGIGMYMLFTGHPLNIFSGIICILIGVIALANVLKDAACPKGCYSKRLCYRNITKEECTAYCECVNPKLREYYTHRLLDRFSNGPGY